MRSAAQQLAEGFHVVLDKNGDLGGHDGDAVDEAWAGSAPPAGHAHPVLRTLGASSAAFALVAGIMAGSMADLPWNDFAEHPGFTAPVEADPVVLGVVGAATPTGPQTVEEILDIIERAELAALESGRAFDAEVQQAAAELGSLLSIYVAQERVALEPRDGLGGARDDVVEIDPAEPDPAHDHDLTLDTDGLEVEELRPPAQAEPPAVDATDADADTGSVRPQDSVDVGTPQVEYADPSDDQEADGADRSRATAEPEPVEPIEVPRLELPTLEELLAADGALPVARPFESVGLLGETEGAEPDDVPAVPDEAPAVPDEVPAVPDEHDEEGHEHLHEAVTFDDVVVAAMRLSTLLDPAAATYVIEVRRAVTELPDGSFVTNDGTPATADGLPLAAAADSLSAALRSVVDQHAASTAGYSNGHIPASVLCDLPWAPGHMLRCDAALQLEALNEAYRERFGTNIPITDSYRSFAGQVAVRAAKPHLAAVPGTSNHGWGLAVDLSTPISSGRSAEYAWLRVHGPDYGWDNPTWARLDGSKPEPWHFEFFAAGPVPDRASSTTDIAGGAAGGTGSNGKSAGAGQSASADTKDGKGKSSDKSSDKKKADKKPDGKKADGAKDKKSDGKKNGTSDGKKADKKKDEPKPKPSTSPKPSPSPSPSPSTSPKPSPSPSPSPSTSPKPTEPAPTPSPSGSPKPTEPAPTPSPSGTPKPSPSPSPSPSEDEGDPDEQEKDGGSKGLLGGVLGLTGLKK
ncbi:hypothetical protein GCM10009718_18680 [Isoptericola halotolerans]|uniref:D-alanyl-D-alanine carboxypeptidase-like core domain-containing protein n=1 Tax=Isoptericola halotolerans TaxID=300560 RepID=A0ABX2A7F9_9MICO|nr:M15 family metallopeptidase [Isoptericola halotolerans]NOV98546.1 hypothetical protein [Isoptericola halotolerans]